MSTKTQPANYEIADVMDYKTGAKIGETAILWSFYEQVGDRQGVVEARDILDPDAMQRLGIKNDHQTIWMDRK